MACRSEISDDRLDTRVLDQLYKVKKDDVREPFCRDKIRQGLERACWKRPISDEQIARVVTEIEQAITDNYDSEIDSVQVGKLVMDHLRELDQVAFVRFASVYRRFKDVRDFVDELQPMLDSDGKPSE